LPPIDQIIDDNGFNLVSTDGEVNPYVLVMLLMMFICLLICCCLFCMIRFRWVRAKTDHVEGSYKEMPGVKSRRQRFTQVLFNVEQQTKHPNPPAKTDSMKGREERAADLRQKYRSLKVDELPLNMQSSSSMDMQEDLEFAVTQTNIPTTDVEPDEGRRSSVGADSPAPSSREVFGAQLSWVNLMEGEPGTGNDPEGGNGPEARPPSP
jgi:hypothetical protein